MPVSAFFCHKERMAYRCLPVAKAPVFLPADRNIGLVEGVLHGGVLVDIASDPWSVFHGQIAVPVDGASGYYLADESVGGAVLLNAEIIFRDIQMPVYGMGDRGDVIRSMPCGFDVIGLSQGGDLAGLGDSADTDHIAAQEINPPSGDGRKAFPTAFVKLPESKGHDGLFAHIAQAVRAVRGYRIFDKKRGRSPRGAGESSRPDPG